MRFTKMITAALAGIALLAAPAVAVPSKTAAIGVTDRASADADSDNELFRGRGRGGALVFILVAVVLAIGIYIVVDDKNNEEPASP